VNSILLNALVFLIYIILKKKTRLLARSASNLVTTFLLPQRVVGLNNAM
jgi:hypothetical protein